ncbi:high mobility group box domain-containing protein [Syncephalastrum racemosum]|uniref:High mobility group box domain-containing protein n=1 Tax=Syncephalastrum racemosum TaxID=13706 RepID=A0A1X2HWL4_SYNRA|nr:high mobility group box domain-containing protein [Syncephalastrum racemosum]
MPSTDRPSRPLNCFIVYRLEKQKEVLAAHPGLNHRDVSRIVGSWWRELSEDEKAPYYELAARNKLEHAQKYPQYKYRPCKNVQRARKCLKKATSKESVQAQFLALHSLKKSPSPPASSLSMLSSVPDTVRATAGDVITPAKPEPKEKAYILHTPISLQSRYLLKSACAMHAQSMPLLCRQLPMPSPLYYGSHSFGERSHDTVILLPPIIMENTPCRHQLHVGQPRVRVSILKDLFHS